jgi:diguanylate cyclase
MKPWVKKLLADLEVSEETLPITEGGANLSEEQATLLFIIDAYSKHLIEIDTRPVRKVRAVFDEFAKGLVKLGTPNSEKLLFRFRQFFSGYRIQEYSYLQKTFEDFKGIIWDFADQLNEGLRSEQARDLEVRASLNNLKEAVEANSVAELKEKSREFIDFYIELQTRNDEQRSTRIDNIQRNLAQVKKKLNEVTHVAQHDHLTGAYNRKFMDEALQKSLRTFKAEGRPMTALAFDIDYFKKINDIFGHDAGDIVLKEFVRLLKEVFSEPECVVARMGGEEFTVLMVGADLTQATLKAEQALHTVRREVIVHSDAQIRYTASIGIAQLLKSEPIERWLKRADLSLYAAKEGGRDRYVIATADPTPKVA